MTFQIGVSTKRQPVAHAHTDERVHKDFPSNTVCGKRFTNARLWHVDAGHFAISIAGIWPTKAAGVRECHDADDFRMEGNGEILSPSSTLISCCQGRTVNIPWKLDVRSVLFCSRISMSNLVPQPITVLLGMTQRIIVLLRFGVGRENTGKFQQIGL